MKTLKIIIAITLVNACVLTGMVLVSTRFSTATELPAAGASIKAIVPVSNTSTREVGVSSGATARSTEQFSSLRTAVSPTNAPAHVATPVPIRPTVGAPVVPSIPAPEPTQDTRCIISVNGIQYDVTVFRTIHGGGNIFTCGTDMTQVFYSQHSDRTLERMQQYKL
jgi:hypothetical protein